MATKEPSLRYTGDTQRRGIKLPTATIRAAERMRMTNPFRNSGAIDRDGNFPTSRGPMEISRAARNSILSLERQHGRATDTDVFWDNQNSPSFYSIKSGGKWYGVAKDGYSFSEPTSEEEWRRLRLRLNLRSIPVYPSSTY